MIFFIFLINLFALNIKVKTDADIIEIDLNQYLVSVIANEVPTSWAAENFKVMAILARTYVLDKYKIRKDKTYFVKDCVLDQVYKPIKNKKNYNKILKEVIATDGLVLFDKKDRIYKVFYHSNCGGITDLPANVWGGFNNYNYKNISCTKCKNAPNSSWTYLINKDKLNKIFFKIYKQDNFKDIDINEYTIKPRIKNLKIIYDDKINILTAQKLRELIGFNKIRSTNFIIDKDKDNYTFKGKGWGHGVGLCQWGMKNLIEEGFDYKKVIEFYYPNAILKKITYEHI